MSGDVRAAPHATVGRLSQATEAEVSCDALAANSVLLRGAVVSPMFSALTRRFTVVLLDVVWATEKVAESMVDPRSMLTWVKRKKKVFDPSDDDLPSRPSVSELLNELFDSVSRESAAPD